MEKKNKKKKEKKKNSKATVRRNCPGLITFAYTL